MCGDITDICLSNNEIYQKQSEKAKIFQRRSIILKVLPNKKKNNFEVRGSGEASGHASHAQHD